MAVTGYPFPYDADNLLVGAVRILYADPADVDDLPASIDDVIDMVSPYHAKAGWKELGATKDSFTYTRAFETSSIEIQQTTAGLFEEITSVTRTLEVSVAELTADTLKIVESSADDPTTVAAAAGASAQKVIKFGAFSSLPRYRFAFLSRRNLASGSVTETGGAVRPRFVMGVAYQASLSANDSALEMAKGELTAAGVTFQLYADDSVTLADEAYGFWAFEDAGTIA